MHTLYL